MVHAVCFSNIVSDCTLTHATGSSALQGVLLKDASRPNDDTVFYGGVRTSDLNCHNYIVYKRFTLHFDMNKEATQTTMARVLRLLSFNNTRMNHDFGFFVSYVELSYWAVPTTSFLFRNFLSVCYSIKTYRGGIFGINQLHALAVWFPVANTQGTGWVPESVWTQLLSEIKLQSSRPWTMFLFSFFPPLLSLIPVKCCRLCLALGQLFTDGYNVSIWQTTSVHEALPTLWVMA